MTQIAATDAAIIRLLESCNFPGVDVASGPHEWDGSYVSRLLTAAPAIRVVFMGADEYSGDQSTSLILAGKWTAYCIVGWNGADESARRLGPDAGYDLLHRCASAIHGAVLMEEDGFTRLPIASVTGLDVLADGALDLSNLWIGAVDISVELPLDLLEPCIGPLDDWLKTAATFDLPGTGEEFDPDTDEIGVDGDLKTQIDMPQ